MKQDSFVALITSAICFLMTGPAYAEVIDVWTYHAYPPFIVNEHNREGLSYDLTELLSENSGGEYEFHLRVIPRERINNRLRSGDTGMVLWVNPEWFDDQDRTKYLWTGPLLQDSNSVISPTSSPFEYGGNYSLIGKTLVGVRGHKYSGIEELVSEGKIERLDVDTEAQAVRMIAANRADALIIASSAANYFAKALHLIDSVHFSKKTQSEYERSIMLQPQLGPVHDHLHAFVGQLPNDRKWKELLSTYGL